MLLMPSLLADFACSPAHTPLFMHCVYWILRCLGRGKGQGREAN